MQLADYIALFPGVSREKSRFMALAEAVLRQVTDLQDVVAAIPAAFSFASAEGAQLDLLAESVGLSRADTSDGVNCTDADFRQFLLAKLALWGWDGTNEGVPDALEAGLPGSTETDNGNGTVTVSPAGGLPAEVKDLAPVPAGVRVNS